jgi:hypothetical protein
MFGGGALLAGAAVGARPHPGKSANNAIEKHREISAFKD